MLSCSVRFHRLGVTDHEESFFIFILGVTINRCYSEYDIHEIASKRSMKGL